MIFSALLHGCHYHFSGKYEPTSSIIEAAKRTYLNVAYWPKTATSTAMQFRAEHYHPT
jgi:hypothetical protein